MNIWGFLTSAILLTIMPGPDILFVLTQSVSKGKKAGIIFASGLCTGLILHIIAVSLGISLLIEKSDMAFLTLKICGASYLIYLGIKSFINRKKELLRLSNKNVKTKQLYARGILMNLLNPKVILFFLAFFPHFVDTNSQNPEIQMCILGFLFIVQAFTIFLLVSILSDKLSQNIIQKPNVSFSINIVEAAIFCIIGISLLFT
jgi:threonine/homoserine/homoserine lactone efflux protein